MVSASLMKFRLLAVPQLAQHLEVNSVQLDLGCQFQNLREYQCPLMNQVLVPNLDGGHQRSFHQLYGYEVVQMVAY